MKKLFICTTFALNFMLLSVSAENEQEIFKAKLINLCETVNFRAVFSERNNWICLDKKRTGYYIIIPQEELDKACMEEEKNEKVYYNILSQKCESL